MPYYAFIAADLIAISILVFGLYFPRHRRRDLIVAFLSINVGVMGVTYAMTNADISLGFGMGIFAVLSIIRLRSTEMDHAEIAYYFTAIALGLLGGFPALSASLSFTLMAVLLGVILVGDNPRLFSRSRQQQMVLDRAFTTEEAAANHLALLLGAEINRVTIRRVDLLTESTMVDVRYTLLAKPALGAEASFDGSLAAERPVATEVAR
ncbi:DUF4956 domain-containing protein [Demequina silvatica]|uniref:DUF4956 domain-containing protein n=1 Tax=Demequina silvatica TaxID=1638988 RepID=UPI0009E2A25B|nr:DUF4956 domain-containing protein [Demequina silvatica]